jgi:hypothetical protein
LPIGIDETNETTSKHPSLGSVLLERHNVMMDEVEGQLARMSEVWNAVIASTPDNQSVPVDWEQSMDSMQREVAILRDRGHWCGGYRTLIHALGIQHRELYLTAGLAWLLDPDGWHCLGNKVLSGLLIQLGLSPKIDHPVVVTTEEARSAGETRADLVVRMSGLTLLVEAKVYADEQPYQCDRLADAWAPEKPSLVFLTTDGRQPRTAVRSAALWQRLTWTQVAETIANAVAKSDCAPGARDLLATIEIFGR